MWVVVPVPPRKQRKPLPLASVRVETRPLRGLVGEGFDAALGVVFLDGDLAFGFDEFFEVAALAPLELNHAGEGVGGKDGLAQGVARGAGPAAFTVFVGEEVEPVVDELLGGVVGLGDEEVQGESLAAEAWKQVRAFRGDGVASFSGLIRLTSGMTLRLCGAKIPKNKQPSTDNS